VNRASRANFVSAKGNRRTKDQETHERPEKRETELFVSFVCFAF
jgi:hypothetical protein